MKFSEAGVSAPATSSEESSVRPLCTISEQKEAEEDQEGLIIERLRRIALGPEADAAETTKDRPKEKV